MKWRKELFEAACQVRLRAHAPFSRFKVGAAVLTEEGHIFGGCNVESASYGLTICAERAALFKAVSEGHRQFTALCVVADTPDITAPCGACRQVIWELCGDIPILLGNLQGHFELRQSRDLLPLPFDRNQLKKD